MTPKFLTSVTALSSSFYNFPGQICSLNEMWVKASAREVKPLGNNGVGFPLASSDVPNSVFATREVTNPNTQSWALLYSKIRDNFKPDAILDLMNAIIDMPPGYRLAPAHAKKLEGCPLGYFVEVFRYAMTARGISVGAQAMMMDSLMIVGEVIVAENFITDEPPVPNPYVNQESAWYTPKKITPVMRTYEFRQVPLSTIQFSWRFPRPFEDTILFDEHPVTLEFNYQGDYRNIVPSNEPLTFSNYYNIQTMSPTGSDAEFYCFSKTSFLYKRYRNPGENELPAQFRTRVIRSAGLRQVLFEPLEATVVGCRLYCPSGFEGNCFDACIQDYLRMFYTPDESMRKQSLVIDMVRKKRSRDEFLYFYQNGYPTQVMNELAEAWYTLEVALFCFRKNRDGKWENFIKVTEGKTKLAHGDKHFICLLQVDDTGTVMNHQTVNQGNIDDGNLGHMLHIISIWPAPLEFSFATAESYGRNALGRARNTMEVAINKVVGEHFSHCYQRNKYWSDINEMNIRELVEKQHQRYSKDQTNTLIFEPLNKKARCDKTKNVDCNGKMKKWLEKHYESAADAPYYMVYAYDIETVSYDPDFSELIYRPFRPRNVGEMYQSKETQIPWSCQWVPVNLSDRGKFKDQKELNGAHIDVYKHDMAHIPEYKDYFLGLARTMYGRGREETWWLGSCVEQMLQAMALDCFERGAKMGIAYAHNGAHFDSYIVLQFQRFEITRILKTSRGIMSVSIKVPVPLTEDDGLGLGEQFVTITLRDTMLQVPGSLAKLCKGFNVPKEFCKLDYPIQMITMKTCYHEEVLATSKPYGENDVYALAYIIRCINDLIGDSPWKPAYVNSMKPPIAQFLTCMAMVKRSTMNHFIARGIPRSLWPKAVDLPALRNWLIGASMGGRVNAYAKVYESYHFDNIMDAYLARDVQLLKDIHEMILEDRRSMQTLDVTSLYPFVMSHCPMPVGKIYSLDINGCNLAIEAMHCADCLSLMSLCHNHRVENTKGDFRPFAIIIVKNVKLNYSGRLDIRNMCGRKVYNSHTGKCMQLNYSLETREEFMKRNPGLEMREVDSFTNIDLYWMRRRGFEFEIVGGFGFGMGDVYNSFIEPAFRQRIEAKKAGNKLLSDFLKLNYNGSFGVTIQGDITDSYMLCKVPEELQDAHPHMIKSFLISQTSSRNKDDLLPSEELTGEAYYLPNGQGLFQKKKKEHMNEFYMDQSPMQIGTAVLAYARHVTNLLMFQVPEEDMTYTDTDSISISDYYTSPDCQRSNIHALINGADDAPMGTYKNDHAEGNGVSPRIVASYIGGRKVKMHITLNELGQVRIFNTFKGLNISTEGDSKDIQFDARYADYRTSMVLYQLAVECTSEAEKVQAWKRDLGKGVDIGSHMQHFDTSSYLSDCQGLVKTDICSGEVELFVPHGYEGHYLDDMIPVQVDEEAKIYSVPGRVFQGADKLKKFLELYYDVSTIHQRYTAGPEYDAIVEKIRFIENE